MTRLEHLFAVFLAVAILGGSVLLPGCSPAQPEVKSMRFELLGLNKPLGLAFTFDTATGTVGVSPLPPALRQPGSQDSAL